MMLKRVMGKASFATLTAAAASRSTWNAARWARTYAAFKQWDIGDIIAIEGSVFKTNKGELSVHATTARLLSVRRCVRCRTSSTAWPTRNCATASATSTSS